MAIDSLLDLEETGVHSGLEGLKILLYGKNTLGKTPQAMKFPKPLLLMGETGGTAIKGYKKAIRKKKDFVDVITQLTNEKTLPQMREKFNTIVIDTVEDMIELFEVALAREYGVKDIGEIQQLEKGNPNGYTVCRKDFKQQINLLTSCGYTVIFIAHEETTIVKDADGNEIGEKIQPKGSKGEKSSSRFIKDLCDYRFYIKGNGVDTETNKTIMSTAWCVETSEFYAGSRFPIQSFINPFTAQGVIDAIIKSQEVAAAEQDARLEVFEIKRDDFSVEDYLEIIKPYFSKLVTLYQDETLFIVNKSLGHDERGKPRKLSSATTDDISRLEDIYCNLVSFACDKGIVVE